MTIGDLFRFGATQWGFRGDHLLWGDMKNTIGNQQLPKTEKQLIELVVKTFTQLTGQLLLADYGELDSVFVEKYNHGGISGGYVCPSFWRDTAIPLLCERYNDVLAEGNPRYQWSRLNNQQIGAYTEYFVKMELTMYGFEVYTTEVDDRGIDFVARRNGGPFLEIQVKSLRKYGYVFMQKDKFNISENVYLAFGLMIDNQPPRLYLIPATTWQSPDSVFVDRTYEGLKSAPEWGFNVSKKNLGTLEKYTFENIINTL